MYSERFDFAQPTSWGYIDYIETDPCGIIKLCGWKKRDAPTQSIPTVYLDQSPVPFLQTYRTARPDLSPPRFGLVFEYLVPDPLRNRTLKQLSVNLAGREPLVFQSAFVFIIPHYASLLNSEEVLHREHIYGSGPPNSAVSPEVIALAESLEGRILDFGCGSGALIRHLRSRGRDANGIELDNPVITAHTYPEVRPFVTLYDGGFPTPYPDRSFDSVFCSEVLEHIPDFEEAVAEMARLSTHRVLLTVPDMSAIPWGFRHALIPWHLLEGTHVNFFTQASLGRLLSRCFSSVEFGRISLCKINESAFHVSLVADCKL
jgi:SAM-dependent methyltransferase